MGKELEDVGNEGKNPTAHDPPNDPPDVTS